ncbi:desmoglein-1 [Tachyglossus aculeatus]|uniref:desmoglein-1 n=1 Tax=Tachyglossus aculeatus TaxID=9261 RepID=UPI0018F3916D|nr:desmoglein-1 [Tachyglossus aculeatus]
MATAYSGPIKPENISAATLRLVNNNWECLESNKLSEQRQRGTKQAPNVLVDKPPVIHGHESCVAQGLCLIILYVVVVEVNSNFQVQVRDYNSKNGTIKWHSVRRHKREWIKFAAACREGEDNSKRNPIAKINSDCSVNQQITYRISGVGIDQPPYGVFIVNPKTGDINITSIVDRELTPFFTIYCRALNSRGEDVERPLELRVRVLDINDNAPIFSQTEFVGGIEENSQPNTLVMILNATDADEPNNLNSKIAFKIISQEPAGAPMFILNRHTGELRTMSSSLDREQQSSYSLVVQGADRDGASDGQSSQCDCRIKIIDVNDNFPYLEQSSYTASIEENTLNSELLRFRAIDLDEEFSDNWLAQFFFVSGNAGNWFEIVTDSRTNEGILRVIKPLNYEDAQSMVLSIGVKNVAEFHQSVISQYRIQASAITVSVINVLEGPVFTPASKTFILQRGMGPNSLIGSYQATDLDTGRPSTTVRYVMGSNPGDLLTVNSRTAEIILKRQVTREIYSQVNGRYVGTILSIDDAAQRTCTGTIVLDLNGGFDPNVPDTTSGPRDGGSGGADFGGLVTPGPGGSTDSTFQSSSTTWNSFPGEPGSDHTSGGRENGNGKAYFGPAGIGLLILGFLMLLLVPFLLLACDCGGPSAVGGGFQPVPECTPEGAIHSWAVEGPQPEDRDMTNICVPMTTTNEGMDTCVSNTGVYTNEYGGREVRDIGGGGIGGGASGLEITTGVKTSVVPEVCPGHSGTLRRNSMMEYREGGVNSNFVKNYFCQKAFAYADEDEGRPSNDCLLIYDIEGVGSSAGSIGCCSFIGEDLDDSFLDNLGPKFKRLADISMGKEVELFTETEHQWTTESTEQSYPPQGTDVLVNGCPPVPPPFGTTTVVSETTYPSGPGVQSATPIPDPLGYGNVMVTESYTTSGMTLQPSAHVHDPRHGSNVVVTERVLGPMSGSDFHGMLDANLRDSSNVIVTERIIAPNSRLPNTLTLPDPRDSSNVVVTERVIRPSSGLVGNISIHPELSSAHNVIVTERVVSGAGTTGGGLGAGSLLDTSMSGGGLSSGSMVGANLGGAGVSGGMSGGGFGLSGGGGGLSSGTLGMSGVGAGMSGSATIGHMRSSDHFNQTIGSASPSASRSRVTKYSTLQYSK